MKEQQTYRSIEKKAARTKAPGGAGGLSNRRPPVLVIALLFLSCLVSFVATAHEPVILPLKIGSKIRPIPVFSTQHHLSLSRAHIPFANVAVGATASMSVTATNGSTDNLTVTASAPAGVIVTPDTFSLTAAPAASRTLTISWHPNQAGPLAGDITFVVVHAGANAPLQEFLPVSGFAGAPAALRFDLPTFQEVGVTGANFGFISVEDVGDNAPTFEMKITNVGDLPAKGLQVIIEGPGATIATLGVCHEGLHEAGICVAEKIGTDGNGNPIFEARSNFGDLAPNQSVTALWRIVPANPGGVDKPFNVKFKSGSETTERSQTFDIAGEVLAYSIPGGGFLKAGAGGTGTDGFGSTVDPLGSDDLGVLRPTGLDARTIFSVGEIDTVDLRTGAMTMVVPIGGEQVVRGSLSYELRAVFNSNIWHRRTMTELARPAIPGNDPVVIPLSGEYPDPLFNLGSGWSFHLGRLFPPNRGGTISVEPACPTNPLDFQKTVDTGPRYVYVDSLGTQHEFWLQLHGNDDPSVTDPYETRSVLYSRDGSFLRMVLDSTNANRRWIEEPTGIKRLFVRNGASTQTLPDEWLLHSIEDQYGNKVTIEYGATTWSIRDHSGAGGAAWRSTVVTFANWVGRAPGDPMVVQSVALPGFAGGAARTYNFNYTTETLNYPSRSQFHTILATYCSISSTAKMPRLNSITLPDLSTYSFNYEHPIDDRIRLKSVNLPTGAAVGYQYAKVWDSPPDCNNATVSPAFNGVSRRTVTEVGGGVLDDRRYLRETLRTADVPNTICRVFNLNDFVSSAAPWSEQTVAVWTAQEAGLSTAAIHHFNVYPYDDSCSKAGQAPPASSGGSTTLCKLKTGSNVWRLKSGRTHIERNLKLSHSQPGDPLDSSLKLSEQLYQCSSSLDGISIPRTTSPTATTAGDDISVLTAACTKRQTTYAQFEVERAGHRCRTASAHCLRDSRLKASRTVFHDDGNRWIKTVNSDFDGLGHFRKSTTRSTFGAVSTNGSLEQTTFQNWNPGIGPLTLNPDHTVANNIQIPTTWLLQTWDHNWTVEGNQGRGGEACFNGQFGHLTHSRTWAGTTVNSTNVRANRTIRDIVVRHAINASTGELDLQRYFGADTYSRSTALPVDDDWCNANNWNSAWQDYAVDFEYQFGHLRQQRVVGDSIFDLRRAIDQGTGWPRTETRDSGEVLTFSYDPMGRNTWSTSARTASQRLQYQKQSNGHWRVTASTYPKGTTAATSAPSPIRVYQADYDGLGRLSTETLPRYNDNPGTSNRNTVTRSFFYNLGGTLRQVTALDNSNRKTQATYDYRGRPLQIIHPNNRKSAFQYSGTRKTVYVSCVKTSGSGETSGICAGTGFQKAETVEERDWKGRSVKVTAPVSGGATGVFQTTYTYDPLDKLTLARRTTTEGSSVIPQNRSWTYDGRGFLTLENTPERQAKAFSNFTTRGHARSVSEGGRVSSLTFDRVGRLRQIAIGNRALKRFVYCDPAAAVDPPGTPGPLCSTSGIQNGKLLSATRNNYRRGPESGLHVNQIPQDGTWVVSSSFDYDTAGRRTNRATSIFGGYGWSSDPALATSVTTFNQSWLYDDLGNVTALGYPTCNTTSSDCNIGRTVGYGFRQGAFLTSVNEGSLGAALTYHSSGLVNTVVHQGGGGTDTYGVTGGMPRIASMDLGLGTTQRFNLGTVGYDGVGNITSIGGDTFLYDKNSRLTNATVQGVTRTYAYDNFDNLRTSSTGTVQTTTNRLTGGDWIYDSFGSLIQGAGHRMVYDELDKLAAIHEPPSSSVSQLGIYDHEDLRILTWQQGSSADPARIWTLRNGLRVIREFTGLGSGIKLDRDYVYAGLRLISSQAFLSTGNEERHYHEDQVGSARLITGATPGRVHYEPFGEPIGSTATGERVVGFQGHENDGLTTYMRGRTYLPFAHRFLQVDPARDTSAWSQYAFVANNPIGSIDPDGLTLLGDRGLIQRAERLANQNAEVAAVLAPYRGPDRDLTFTVLQSLTRQSDGMQLAGKFGGKADFGSDDAAIRAHEKQHGLQATIAAESQGLFKKIDFGPTSIVLITSASDETLLHELGHMQQFLTDTETYFQQADQASRLTGNAYETSDSETFAKSFATRIEAAIKTAEKKAKEDAKAAKKAAKQAKKKKKKKGSG